MKSIRPKDKWFYTPYSSRYGRNTLDAYSPALNPEIRRGEAKTNEIFVALLGGHRVLDLFLLERMSSSFDSFLVS